ncbi:GNAT family N-acetyltransferase [Williamsia deligens]|uniref:GNAT family N-acetyltransferase n=1 Tax=Williamsia deligens TaxID=321325 RepID=A0ABW3GAH3_9NOCA|nr:GNAT family N-acetyltransferase [Williamsia deligens]MCP2193244.1 Protein N-acetyltransferase, RimJ/RimL family [Williamsia deligens]
MIAHTSRLTLAPVGEQDVDDFVALVIRPELYVVIGGAPADHGEARGRVERWLAGSPDPRHLWINHVVRHRDTGSLIGHCQGTITTDDDAGAPDCVVGYTVHPDHHGQGVATEMMRAFVDVITSEFHPRRFVAHIAPGHEASEHVAAALGLFPTGRLDDAGERIWASHTTP